MTVARLTQRRSRLEKQAQAVLDALVTDNLTQAEVAVKFKVSPNAVSEFVRRHSVELAEQQAAVMEAATIYRIAIKEMRIAEAQKDYDTIEEWLSEHGLSERSVRYDKDGNEVGETIRFRKDLVDARRQLRRDVAEELGQLPRPDQNINVRAQLLIREIGGTDIDVS